MTQTSDIVQYFIQTDCFVVWVGVCEGVCVWGGGVGCVCFFCLFVFS